MSERANREGSKSIFPFIEYRDENNVRYFIDTFSKPWLYVFLNFRILFPVNAIVIDKKHVDTEKNNSNNINKHVGIYGAGMGFAIVGVLNIFLKQFPISDVKSYQMIFKIIIFSMYGISGVIMWIARKKIIERENLDKMKKVVIKPKLLFSGFIMNGVYLFLVITALTFQFSSEIKISLFEVVGTFCFGAIAIAFTWLQWAVFNFSSKDVKEIKLKK